MKRELVTSLLTMLCLLVLARWLWALFGGQQPTGPLGVFTWAAYLVGGIIALSILGSASAGIWFVIHRVLHAKERAQDVRKLFVAAHCFFVDAAGGSGPYQLGMVRLVPSLALAEVEFRAVREPVGEERLSAMRTIVNDAVARIRRDAPPGTWVDALPAALASLQEHGLTLRGPSPGGYWRALQEMGQQGNQNDKTGAATR